MLCSNQSRLRPGLAVPRRPAAGADRLAALEPHFRRQPQFQPRAVQRRHALDRRRQARRRALIERSVANLREIAPTLYLNVPRGLRRSARSAGARRRARARLLSPSSISSSMPAPPCRRACGSGSRRWRFAPSASRRPGLGLGHDRDGAARDRRPLSDRARRQHRLARPRLPRSKLVPAGDKLEIRVRGPNVTPGYWRRPDLTAAAFDDGRLLSSGRRGAPRGSRPSPARGIVFDGRLGENFKLSSGHLGQRRRAARGAGRGLRAPRRGCRHRRP